MELFDEELEDYKMRVGQTEFRREYTQLYHQAKRSKRYSGNNYQNSPDRLQALKEKYKNGVSKEIIVEMVRDFR